MIFAIGPLTGTGFPYTSRFVVGAKFPLTDVYGDANCGGYWAAELKFAGYDALVFQGRSEKPVYLWIDDNLVELRDAKDLWGKTTDETPKIVREEHCDHSLEVACCGSAGENLVRFAGIRNHNRYAARSGLGGVMGSKKIKAIAVRGSKDVEVAKPKELYDYMRAVADRLKDRVKFLRTFGKAGLNDQMNEMARWPVKNFQSGYTAYKNLSCLHPIYEETHRRPV